MSPTERIDAFIDALRTSLDDRSFVKLRLAGYEGPEPDLKNVDVRRITVKGEEKLSFTYHYKTRDIIKNHAPDEALSQIAAGLGDQFRAANLSATAFDLAFERNGGKVRLTRREVDGRPAPEASHDRAKNRPLAASARPWQVGLKLTDEAGHVRKDAQDKFRQINKMVEIFAPLIQSLKGERPRIVDMGAGKGYLDFALADYLSAQGRAFDIVGVELRPQLVDDGNALAQKSGFAHLRFVPGAILDFDASGADAVIALHACDTATDDAIYKGIVAGAQLVAVAPCCHKQVRRSMHEGHAAAPLESLLRHGVFMERQAEMVTDTIRALLLEAHGYRTKVFEFVSDAHTPKNNLIVAEKDARLLRDREAVLRRIAEIKTLFGVGGHYLEDMLHSHPPAAGS